MLYVRSRRWQGGDRRMDADGGGLSAGPGSPFLGVSAGLRLPCILTVSLWKRGRGRNGSACCLGHQLCLTTQDAWRDLQQQGISEAAETGGAGTLLLRVIANSAKRFPVAQAAQLAADLLKVRAATAQLLYLNRLGAPC